MVIYSPLLWRGSVSPMQCYVESHVNRWNVIADLWAGKTNSYQGCLSIIVKINLFLFQDWRCPIQSNCHQEASGSPQKKALYKWFRVGPDRFDICSRSSKTDLGEWEDMLLGRWISSISATVAIPCMYPFPSTGVASNKDSLPSPGLIILPTWSFNVSSGVYALFWL